MVASFHTHLRKPLPTPHTDENVVLKKLDAYGFSISIEAVNLQLHRERVTARCFAFLHPSLCPVWSLKALMLNEPSVGAASIHRLTSHMMPGWSLYYFVFSRPLKSPYTAVGVPTCRPAFP